MTNERMQSSGGCMSKKRLVGNIGFENTINSKWSLDGEKGQHDAQVYRRFWASPKAVRVNY